MQNPDIIKAKPDDSKPEAHHIVRVACDVVCDRRTVLSYFAGRRVSSTMRARIEASLCTLGLQHLVVDNRASLTAAHAPNVASRGRHEPEVGDRVARADSSCATPSSRCNT